MAILFNLHRLWASAEGTLRKVLQERYAERGPLTAPTLNASHHVEVTSTVFLLEIVGIDLMKQTITLNMMFHLVSD